MTNNLVIWIQTKLVYTFIVLIKAFNLRFKTFMKYIENLQVLLENIK